MTYIELINAFWSRRMVWPLTSYEADFYFYLLKECNSRNWTNPFKLPTQILERELNLNRRTICEIRNKLIQSGYIDVTPSTKRGEVTEYEIVDICEDPYDERKPNTNRTQTERKPNIKRTQTEHKANANCNANRTQTEHLYKTKDLDLDKEISTIVDTKKDESDLFGARPQKVFDGQQLDFVADEYFDIFVKWLEYKKQRRESYKSTRSLTTCYNQLVKYADNNVEYADYIVDRSIGNNWQGLFQLNQRDIDFINKQKSNGARIEPNGAATVPRRTSDDYDEEDD